MSSGVMKSEGEWIEMILRAKEIGLSIDEIVDLSLDLAHSGEVIGGWEFPTADLASTGGPSSLSTLLVPLHLVEAGCRVPKLGVPGRPAGGVDTLAQIEGYRTTFSRGEVERLLPLCRYVHFESGDIFAPADAATFRLRQEHGCQSVADLAVASLLSKKVALAVDMAGLEIRVGRHGNFGASFSEARVNARTYMDVAKRLGLRPICILTDASVPYQPYVGRGEAIWALSKIFRGEAERWLLAHHEQCAFMADEISGKAGSKDIGKLWEIFAINCRYQGGQANSIHQIADHISLQHTNFVVSPSSGFCRYDLANLRHLLVAAQSKGGSNQYPDTAGVRLLIEPGRRVSKGEPIMSWRSRTADADFLKAGLADCYAIEDIPANAAPIEVINE
tara:strand:+ start:6538 stop:7707 length:1170 start_codon:yes stop_codon:yes gene_type:complete